MWPWSGHPVPSASLFSTPYPHPLGVSGPSRVAGWAWGWCQARVNGFVLHVRFAQWFGLTCVCTLWKITVLLVASISIESGIDLVLRRCCTRHQPDSTGQGWGQAVPLAPSLQSRVLPATRSPGPCLPCPTALPLATPPPTFLLDADPGNPSLSSLLLISPSTNPTPITLTPLHSFP